MRPFAEFEYAAAGLPDGFAAVPVAGDASGGPIRVCVLFSREPDPVGGHFVLLRDNLDAKVYLGCILDAGNQVQQWVEIFVQTVGDSSGKTATYREAVTNTILDERWRAFCDAATVLQADGIVRTGWETKHPPPVFVNTQTGEGVVPKDASGRSWGLCEDDALLEQHGLPPYRSSLARYLFSQSEGRTLFVPVTPDSPRNEHTITRREIPGCGDECIAMNPEGGLLMVRAFYPFDFEEFVDILGGATWDGLGHGRELLDPTDADAGCRLSDRNALGRLFLAADGTGGRLLESLHLKLGLLLQAFEAVRGLAREQRRPLLNLTADSLRVRVPPASSALPFLWSAHVSLTDPGDAAILPVETSDSTYYFRARETGVTIYRPATGMAVRGRGVMRIRQVMQDVRKGTIVEGTFQPREDIAVDPHDLIWLRITLKDEPMDLYATMEEDRALSLGEWRFRTVGQELAQDRVTELSAAEGAPLQNIPFQVFPLLSTPCDLYALLVLAVRTLLVDKRTTLPVALDEVASLAREAGAIDDPNRTVPERIADLFARDNRWTASLGPHRLLEDEIEPSQAFGFVPAEIWWDVLAMLVTMLPGNACSTCRDYGDAPPKAVHKVMDQCVADAEELVRLTRGLVVTDWQQNSEVRTVIDDVLERVKGV